MPGQWHFRYILVRPCRAKRAHWYGYIEYTGKEFLYHWPSGVVTPWDMIQADLIATDWILLP